MYELTFVWRHSTLIIPSMTAPRQSTAASARSFLIWLSSQSAAFAIGRVDVSGETTSHSISLWLAVDIFTCSVHSR